MPQKKNLPKQPASEQYADFLRGLKLVGLGLEKCSADLNRELFAELTQKQRAVRRIQSDYGLTETGKEFFEVSAKFRLTVTDKSKASKSPAMSILCVFAAHFHVQNPPTNEQFAKRFADSELRIVMWPYFRQFVSDTTARMHIWPMLIPFSSPLDRD